MMLGLLDAILRYCEEQVCSDDLWHVVHQKSQRI
jgi:hypothetical protein